MPGGGKTRHANLLVLCGGIGSRRLMERIGHPTPMISERGNPLEGEPAAITKNWPEPIVLEDRSVVLNRFAHGLRIAGFVEYASAAAAPDPWKWTRLQASAMTSASTFLEESGDGAGARPTFPDNLPAIGGSTLAHNLIYAFGHQHLGPTLAPVTAELISALAFEQDIDVLPTSFAIERFR